MKVTKAIIPAAGLGTRFLPVTKAIPKEMMPVLDKPPLHYIAEEAVLSGAKDVLIIVNEGKESIRTYFSSDTFYDGLHKPELEELNDLLASARFHFVTQKELNGIGGAILLAKDFAEGQAVSVLSGDDVIYSPQNPVTKQLIDAFTKVDGKTVVGCQMREPEEVIKYAVIAYEKQEGRLAKIADIIEKPPLQGLPSRLCSLGRFVIPYSLFNVIEDTPPVNGEIYLTNAIRRTLQTEGAYAYEFEGTRYDIGDKFGYLQANVEYALRSPMADKVKAYLKELTKKL